MLVKVKISCMQSWTHCNSDVTRVGEGPLGDAEKGAGVTGSFPKLQGAQNIMYEPRDGVPGISSIKRKSDCQSE